MLARLLVLFIVHTALLWPASATAVPSSTAFEPNPWLELRVMNMAARTRRR